MANDLNHHQLTTLKNKIIQQQSTIYQLAKEGLFSHRFQNHQYSSAVSNAAKKSNGRVINVNIKPKKQCFDTLLEMDTALMKMKNNTYGICGDCQGNIGFERLNQYPSSQRCLRCASQLQFIGQRCI